MSTVSKGKQFEREARQILEADGWMVEQAFNKTVFIGAGRIISVAHDFFGCWDLIAKKLDQPTKWVQVTVWEQIAQKRKDLAVFQWNPDFDEPCIYARIRGRNGHFRVLYARDNYEWLGETKMVLKKKKIVIEEKK